MPRFASQASHDWLEVCRAVVRKEGESLRGADPATNACREEWATLGGSSLLELDLKDKL